MKKSTSAFTIVELLIVIVVIAILAAVSIVAYNGIQARAENAKSIQAASAWAKALQMFKADNGNYPVAVSCLGNVNTYADSHNGRCWGPSDNSTWYMNNTFLNAMDDYLTTYPEPSNKDINANTDGNQYRGAMYYRPTGYGSEEIRVSLFGIATNNDCPDISGLVNQKVSNSWTNGRSCRYSLPQ